MNKRVSISRGRLFATAALTTMLVTRTMAATASPELADMSLEALMDIEVTTVSKRPQSLSGAAAAVFVLTGDDLRRAGATSIPEALRLVPGLQVAQIDANKWAISARGFNSRFANKLLVMIDGRSVYTPLFAGVYWDMQDTPLEDIERIEVVRGPGGTLWGANAVNGVINIITRSAADTHGGLLSLSAGEELSSRSVARYGGGNGEDFHYRFYAQRRNIDEGYNADGAHDGSEIAQLGFRSDWALTTRDAFTFQGDLYEGDSGEQVTIPSDPAPAATTLDNETDISGGNLLGRWTRELGQSRVLTIQTWFDHVKREEVVLYDERDTLDLDVQYLHPIGARHTLLVGSGFRHIEDESRNDAVFALDPDEKSSDLYSAFVQDEILVAGDTRLTLGSKFEHNDFSGFEYQPSARLAWTPPAPWMLWSSVSRAVRTPARGEHDVRLRLVNPPGSPPLPLLLTGDDDFDSEELIAYEAGARYQHGSVLSLDAATFYNDYDKLRTFDGALAPGPSIGFPFANDLKGQTWGFELSADWRPSRIWRSRLGYAWLDADLDLVNGSADETSRSAEASSPTRQATFWNSVDLAPGWGLDVIVRYVDDIEVTGTSVDDYTELDLRVGWRPAPWIELSVAGRNLLDHHHAEFAPDFIATQPTEVERGVFGQVRVEF